jgi:hypothetical protein
MKKSILVYDAGELICSVQVVIDDTKLHMPERIHISFNGTEYDIMYVMGMYYAIIVPALPALTEIEDYTNIH